MKEAGLGKQRLSSCLSAERRSRLIELMLEDVVGAVRSCEVVREVWIVTRDSRFASAGVRVIGDAEVDINASLARAAIIAAQEGAHTILVIPGDVPLASGRDIQQLVLAARSHDVVIVPDREGMGTNALALSPPTLLRPHFGEDSRRRHVDAGLALGAAPLILDLPGLAYDVDLPEHLETLLLARPQRYGFLRDPVGEGLQAAS
jgi:2-phospho-L-lactate guanylyltransferase